MTSTAAALPDAPSDDEVYLYFGRQHVWFITLRTLATFGSVTSLLLFSFARPTLWLFWVPFSIFTGYMFLTHYTTTRRREVTREGHDLIVRNWAPGKFPSVDVFLPCAGEDIEVLANTYRHVAQLRYRGELQVYVLDDSARPEVEQRARQYGFTYLTRPDRGHMKKAGNLKFGYERSSGDFIVIFDADFCPRPDFLTQLMPYFGDEEIAIVQSPQFFDTGRRMHWLQRCAGSVQESFYRWAQVSRNTLGAPICVGTNAIYRRAGLQKSGGFAQIGHSEDVHTGVNLLKAGYRTVYVPVILAKGLCPETMSSFISQQYRWCAGSMSLLRDKAFHDSPLTYRQRMCFFTGFGYYISTAVGVFALPLPTIAMLWFLPDHVRLSNFFWLLPTLFMYPIIAMMHRTGWSMATLRVYLISSFSHAAAIWHTMIGRTAAWVPSGETKRTSMTSKVTTLMVVWTLTADVLLLAGAARFLLLGYSPVDVTPIVLFTGMGLFTAVPVAALARRERRDRLIAAAAAAAATAAPAAAADRPTAAVPARSVWTVDSPIRRFPATTVATDRVPALGLPTAAGQAPARRPSPRPAAPGAVTSPALVGAGSGRA